MSTTSRTKSALMTSVFLLTCVPVGAQESELDGITVFGEQTGYRKNWALLIGINYTGRQEELRGDPANQRALPELNNAANDAKELANVLKSYYLYDDDAVRVLTDDADDESDIPTAARIRDELNELCLPDRVQPDDSVLIFFAGHGFKLDRESTLSGNAVSLLPYDVTLSHGRPVGTNTFDLPDGLFELVAKIPARHKMIVLDCCYSGEIFNARGNVGFQSRSDAANRSDTALQQEPTFQAMAACRALQVASDGKTINSKFTTALLDGLRHIPARSDGDRRVWANRLLAYMRPNFDETQRPDCRNLIRSTGEFCFFPREAEQFSEFALHDDDKSHLRAMVVSRRGDWWFDEMPWFIPGIRSEIVKEYEDAQPVVRSGSFSDLIRVEELKETAQRLIQDNKGTVDGLRRLRFGHAQELLQARDAKKLEAALERIESELNSHLPAITVNGNEQAAVTRSSEHDRAASQAIELAPEDIHFLAVIQHSLGKIEEAGVTYDRAIKAYTLAQSQEQDRLRLHILAALCRADQGEFRSAVLREPLKAAKDFETARRAVLSLLTEQNRTTDSAAFFRIFMLCREADAWLAVNRWSQANRLLREAVDVAEALAPNHFLQAHVHRRRAWAKIIQWEIQEAKCSFERSNEILYAQFVREAEARGEIFGEPHVTAEVDVAINDSDRIDADESVETLDAQAPAPMRKSLSADCQKDAIHGRLSSVFRESTDHASKVAYLHNLHGIAMATRFHGDTPCASRYYRWLAGEVEDALSRFLDSATDTDLESQLIGRVINTQERLGDCNLFGNPEFSDPKEAFDDYRRAMNRVHLLHGTGRDRLQTMLLYKQALALSLPSAIQDTELALQMCRRADETYEMQREKATGLFQALGELTTKIVQQIDVASQVHLETADELTSPGQLREAILEYRDVVGRTPHRDQLEMCLFASKVLLENSGHLDTYQAMADADLLLSFCRLALSPYERDDAFDSDAGTSLGSESRAYLRPYYDAVMRAKLTQTNHVKELLEIQAEATHGTYYVKPEESHPILAIYTLGNECFLISDLPNGDSDCVSLSEMYDIETIRAACETSKTGLPLPRDIHQSMMDWRSRLEDSQDVQVELRWEDPIRGFIAVRRIDTRIDESVRSAAKPIVGQFPFDLPAGFSDAPQLPNQPADEQDPQ